MPTSVRMFVSSTAAMLVIGLLALCVIVASTVWLGERAQGIAQQVIQTRDVKALAVDLRTALLTAESSQRGFLYTGNEIYLAPYAQGKMRAESNIQNLPDALKDFPEFTPALQRLKENVDAKVLEMDQSIALKRDRQDEQAFELLRSNRGKQLMDEAN
ncbi:MAG TPA: CHASE3 domain-containing protein, partial [Devosia sp.]